MTEAERLAKALTDWSTREVRDLDRLDAADLIRSQAAELEALKQTLHDELDANLRLRELGGARSDEPMTTFLERVFAERDALRADAERYRWLREQHEGKEELQYDAEGFPMPLEPTALAFTVFMPDRGDLVPVGCIGGELDAAIDAARQSNGA